jgi:hypothetical protein
VAVASNNNLLSVGGFRGSIDFDPGPGISMFNAVSIVGGDMILRKVDPAGNLIWVKHFAGMSPGVYGLYGWAIDLDSSGNIYIGGTIRDSFDVDPGPLVYNLSTNGGEFAFILKLDSAGSFIWSKTIGNNTITNNGSNMLSIHIIKNAIYIAGDFMGSVDADFGPATVNITSASSGSPFYAYPDLFIEKMDTNGNFIWVKTIGGSGADVLASMDVDSISNLYFTGNYQSSVDFDPGPAVYTLTSPTTPPSIVSTTYVVKLDSSGNFIWAKSLTSNDNQGASISVDRSANVVVTGYFSDTVDFDPGPGIYNLWSNSTRSAFSFKLKTNGDFQWAKKTGGVGGLFGGRAVYTDDLGNIYTALELPYTCDINPGPGVFIAGGVGLQKLDSLGNFVWGAGLGGSIPSWIGLDHSDNLYTTGSFSGSNSDFDPGPDTYAISAGSNQGSGFILKLCQSDPDTITIVASSDTACIGDTVVLSAPLVPGATYRWYHYNTLLAETSNTLLATTWGDYRVRVGGASCPSVGYINAPIYPVVNPDISLPAGPQGAFNGQAVNLTATVLNGGIFGYLIDWYRNNTLFATTTTDTTSYIKTPGTDTIVAVIYSNNPCFTPDTSNGLIISTPTGVYDLSKHGISVFPNPSTGMFTISAPDLIGEIEVLEMSGALLYDTKPKSRSAVIDLSHRADGVYFYKLKLRDGWVRGKLIVARSE